MIGSIELSRRGQLFICNTSQVFFLVLRSYRSGREMGIEHEILRFDRGTRTICEMERPWMDDPNDDRYTRVA